MDIHTHHLIDQELCGQPVDLQPGYCRVSFTATDRMAADDKGLVHGGFVFGLADYAAMLAVNDPHVVLGAAEVRFLKPVRIGAILSAVAEALAFRASARISINSSRSCPISSSSPAPASAGGFWTSSRKSQDSAVGAT